MQTNIKILAVILAKAGTKGIPNKNIRIIGKHPLVNYTIYNVLHLLWVLKIEKKYPVSKEVVTDIF